MNTQRRKHNHNQKKTETSPKEGQEILPTEVKNRPTAAAMSGRHGQQRNNKEENIQKEQTQAKP